MQPSKRNKSVFKAFSQAPQHSVTYKSGRKALAEALSHHQLPQYWTRILQALIRTVRSVGRPGCAAEAPLHFSEVCRREVSSSAAREEAAISAFSHAEHLTCSVYATFAGALGL